MLASGKNDDLNVSLGVFFSGHDIKMAFGDLSCVKTVGAGGRHDGELPLADQEILEAQLNQTVSSGSFILKVDKVDLTGHIIVGYERTVDTDDLNLAVRFEYQSNVDLISSNGTQDVFEFTGTIEVLADGGGGRQGQKGPPRNSMPWRQLGDGDRHPGFGLTRRSASISRPCAGSD